jgi:hypothetical protein
MSEIKKYKEAPPPPVAPTGIDDPNRERERMKARWRAHGKAERDAQPQVVEHQDALDDASSMPGVLVPSLKDAMAFTQAVRAEAVVIAKNNKLRGEIMADAEVLAEARTQVEQRLKRENAGRPLFQSAEVEHIYESLSPEAQQTFNKLHQEINEHMRSHNRRAPSDDELNQIIWSYTTPGGNMLGMRDTFADMLQQEIIATTQSWNQPPAAQH